MKNSKIIACSLLALGCVTSLAWADDYTGPENTLRLGYYFVSFNSSSTPITGPYVPAETPPLEMTAKNVNTPYFSYLRRLSTHWDFELAFGVPPKTETIAKGPASVGSVPYNGVVLGSAKWVAPTALIEYKFLQDDSMFRPYVGIGVNYTAFEARKSSPGGDAVAGGPTSIDQTVSVGPAATLGLKVSFSQHWHVMASANYSNVHSDITLTTAGENRTTHVTFDPFAAVVALGYSF
jgi:outer membrane protein